MAIDGKVWWVAYDIDEKDYACIPTLPKCKTKKDMQYYIDKLYKNWGKGEQQ